MTDASRHLEIDVAAAAPAAPHDEDSDGYQAFDIEPAQLRRGMLVDAGRLRVLHVIGRGGMATVYEATEVGTGRNVALKVLAGKYAKRADAEPRLFAEAKYASVIGPHANIVKPLWWGHLAEAGGAPFLVSELVLGPQLTSLCGDASVPAEIAVGILRDLAGVLAQLHAAGVVHRDVKPDNVLVESQGRRRVPKLMDFGLATRIDAAIAGTTGALTGVHDRPGTKHYMAPEQCIGLPATPSMDVYAFGVTAYELFVGSPPMANEDPFEVVQRKCDPNLPPFSLVEQKLPSVRGDVAELVDRALRCLPNERPKMSEIHASLVELARRIAAGEPSPDAPSPAAPADPRELRAVDSARLAAFEAAETIAVRRNATPAPRRAPEQVIRTEIAPVPRAELLLRMHRVGVPVAAAEVVEDAEVVVEPRPRRGWLLILAGGVVATALVVAAIVLRPDETPTPTVADEATPAVALPPEHGEPRERPTSPVETKATQPRDPMPSAADAAVRVDDPPNPPAAKPTPRALPEVPKHESNACRDARARAQQAEHARSWQDLLDATADRGCWLDAGRRRELRVNAHVNLRNWAACVRDGRGSKDPDVTELVAMCQSKVDNP